MSGQLQTPRRLGVGRPSLGSSAINTASSPNLSASAAFARKASLQALTGAAAQMSPGNGADIAVGDLVDVPGGMYGTAKFVGNIAGKSGVFLGVELARHYAAKGKNNGDVDGVRYFRTSMPNAGIFLPLHRAAKRDLAQSDHPPTPGTPTYGSMRLRDLSSPSQTIPKFTQSVGPGARPPSPNSRLRSSRPSLPRPESPLRKIPNLTATPGRLPSLSRSQIGSPRPGTSPAPRAALHQPVKTPQFRASSRNNSRLAFREDASKETTPTPGFAARSSDGSAAGSGAGSGSTFTPMSRRSTGDADEEIKQLKQKLQERDQQLKDQSSSLEEMEKNLAELSKIMPLDGSFRPGETSAGSAKDLNTAQLRAIVREKNERIAMLTAEFDAHRADFRSTIDTLEMASTETERVYEKRVDELLAEIREMQTRSEDVADVTAQMKLVEEMVAELEEGLEDARRGEAEARGEVEFLRGEVERTRAELKQARDRSGLKDAGGGASAPASPDISREKEQMQDEIRGLRAIIHSLSSGGGSPVLERPSLDRKASQEQAAMKSAVERLERERKELQGLILRKNHREEELEREIERLRAQKYDSTVGNGVSEHAAMRERNASGRDSRGTVVNWRGSHDGRRLASMAEGDANSVSTGSGALWCEICEAGGHDVLTCGSVDRAPGVSDPIANGGSGRIAVTSPPSQNPDQPRSLAMLKKSTPNLLSPATSRSEAPPSAPLPNPYAMMGNPSIITAGKDGTRDPSKWCALLIERLSRNAASVLRRRSDGLVLKRLDSQGSSSSLRESLRRRQRLFAT